MVVDAGSPGGAAPLTGRQKHAEKVAAKRALRDEKASIKKQRPELVIPESGLAKMHQLVHSLISEFEFYPTR